jgi:hypothetical protein
LLHRPAFHCKFSFVCVSGVWHRSGCYRSAIQRLFPYVTVTGVLDGFESRNIILKIDIFTFEVMGKDVLA